MDPARPKTSYRREYGALATLALLIAAASAGCGDDATLEVGLAPEERFPGLTLTIDDGTGVQRFTRTDLESRGESGLTTGRVDVVEEGTIHVRIHLEAGGEDVADGGVQLEAREAFRWSVSFAYGTTDPTEECLGCLGSVEIPVAESHRTSPDEALWAVWGGRREGSDVVF